MAEPELWTRCPKHDDLKRRHCLICMGYPDHGLVRVPFDEAVERMTKWERRQEAVPTPATDDALRAACEAALCAALNIASSDVKASASRPNLRAALGGTDVG